MFPTRLIRSIPLLAPLALSLAGFARPAAAQITCVASTPTTCPGTPVIGSAPLAAPVAAFESLTQQLLPPGVVVVPGDAVLTDNSPYGDDLRFLDTGAGVSIAFLLCSDEPGADPGANVDATCSLPFSANAQFGPEATTEPTAYTIIAPGGGVLAAYNIFSDAAGPGDLPPPVPEPGSTGLFIMALAGLGWMRHRKIA
jgi:hypothetical protein